jgi:hypothetical protein
LIQAFSQAFKQSLTGDIPYEQNIDYSLGGDMEAECGKNQDNRVGIGR